jgi:MerR family mercuric resistance operon transcriptional regulator
MTRIEMTIGRLAEAAGVHVETIRYYQRLGLLPAPARRRGGQRRYGGDELQRVCFIKRAQGLGFSLEEIRRLLDFAQSPHCAETQAMAQRKLVLVERKIADLNALRATLLELVRACESGGREGGCPIIESLSERPVGGEDGRETG